MRFDDWMWLQPGDALINRANVYRWGLWIGTVSLFFLPEGRLAQPGTVNAAVQPPAAAE